MKQSQAADTGLTSPRKAGDCGMVQVGGDGGLRGVLGAGCGERDSNGGQPVVWPASCELRRRQASSLPACSDEGDGVGVIQAPQGGRTTLRFIT